MQKNTKMPRLRKKGAEMGVGWVMGEWLRWLVSVRRCCNGKNWMQLRQLTMPRCFLSASFPPLQPLCIPHPNLFSIQCVAHTPCCPFHVRPNALSRQQPQMLHISLGCQRKWPECGVLRGGGWDDLTDRQHGRVCSLQLLCQSADLSIYINLLSSGIVVAFDAAADAHADIDAFSRNLQVNFVSDASTLASAWLTNNWLWQCSI